MVSRTRSASPQPKPAPSAADGIDTEHLQLTTLQGWRRFVQTIPHIPDLVDDATLATLAPDQKLAYDEARLTHHAQLLTIPVFACAWASILMFGFASDRLKLRGPFLMAAYSIAAVGWIMLLAASADQRHVAFAGTFVVAIGTYPSVILNIGWMNTNIIGFTKR